MSSEPPANFNIERDIPPDGTATLGGTKPAASDFDTAGEVEVQRLVIRLSSSGGLAGSLDYVVRYTANQNFETSMTTRSGEIASATRVASEPVSVQTPFQGHWVGQYVIRSCTFSGWSNCGTEQPGRTYALDLALIQTGSTVSGTLMLGMGIPLTGTAASNSLVLQGSSTLAASGGFDVVRVMNWSTTTDGIGRMQGSFTYVRESHFTAGVNAGAVWTQTYNVDLVSVVLVP